MGLIPNLITHWWTEWQQFWWDFFIPRNHDVDNPLDETTE